MPRKDGPVPVDGCVCVCVDVCVDMVVHSIASYKGKGTSCEPTASFSGPASGDVLIAVGSSDTPVRHLQSWVPWFLLILCLLHLD